MDFERNDVWVGALVVGAAAVLLAALFFINRRRFAADTYPVEIHLPNISGIDKGVEVIYKGYRAGTVDRVTIDYEPEVRFNVRLALRREVRLRSGTTVIVRSKGFAGAKMLELSPPPMDVKNEGYVRPGDVLFVYVDPDLMAKANEVLGKVQKAVGDFQRAGTGAELQEAILDAHAVLVKLDRVLTRADAVLSENRVAISSTVARTDRLLAGNEEKIDRIVENLDQTLIHLPTVAMLVEELVADLKRHPWRLLRKGKPKGPPTVVVHEHPRHEKKPAGEESKAGKD